MRFAYLVKQEGWVTDSNEISRLSSQEIKRTCLLKTVLKFFTRRRHEMHTIRFHNKLYDDVLVWVVGPDQGSGNCPIPAGGDNFIDNCPEVVLGIVAFAMPSGLLVHLGKTKPDTTSYDIVQNVHATHYAARAAVDDGARGVYRTEN